MTLLLEISRSMRTGRVNELKDLISEALDSGISADTILNDSLILTMESIGEDFSKGDVFIPEVMMAARAMNEGLKALKPYLALGESKPIGRVIICTVKGDSHDIGKNLVKIMMEGSGIEVIDLGVNVPSDKVIKASIELGINIICLSCLLTTSMPMLKDVIHKLVEAGIRDRTKVIIGGAPVTLKYAQSIGADGYADDAAGAAKLVKSILSNL